MENKTNLQSILYEILNIIEFSDDKNEFVQNFISRVSLQIIADLLGTLSEEARVEVRSRIDLSEENIEEVTKILKEVFTEDQIRNTRRTAITTSLANYIDAIIPTLSDDQKERILTIQKSLSN